MSNMKKKRPYVMTARSAKAAATRDRICESAMQLYCEGSLDEFTLDDVARRAGTTVQTVLRAFGSKDNLIVSALDRYTQKGSPILSKWPGGFKPTPPDDIEAAVATLFELYETIGDLVIQQLADERRRPSLKPGLDLGRENHRIWVKSVFAPQLKGRNGHARAQLFNILVVATDVYVWKLLRRDLGLMRPAAEAAVRAMILSTTREEKADGTGPLAQLVRRRQPAA